MRFIFCFPPPHLQQALLSHIIPKLLFSALLLGLVRAADPVIDINQIFNVKTGTTQGGCDNYLTDLKAYAQEAYTLVKAAQQTFANARKSQNSYDAELIESMFGINTVYVGMLIPNKFNDATRADIIQGMSYISLISDLSKTHK